MTKITIEVRNLWDKAIAYTLLEKELELSYKIKREKLKELLDLSIEMGVLITLTDEQLRGSGKTSAIIEKSNELSIPIVVSNRQQKIFLKEQGAKKVCCVGQSSEQARGYRFDNGFLVDEGAEDDVIKELIKGGNKLLGGFKRL